MRAPPSRSSPERRDGDRQLRCVPDIPFVDYVLGRAQPHDAQMQQVSECPANPAGSVLGDAGAPAVAAHGRTVLPRTGQRSDQSERRGVAIPGNTTRTMSPRSSSPVPVWMVALCDSAMSATNDRPMPLPRTGVPAAR
jgi:hypothetical protein